MKNIVICFDGTWNTADEEFPTNVVKTAQLVLPVDARGVTQMVFYDQGVGSMQVAFGSAINNFLGGAFGVGLMDNIESAYRFLTFNYALEDRIFNMALSRIRAMDIAKHSHRPICADPSLDSISTRRCRMLPRL